LLQLRSGKLRGLDLELVHLLEVRAEKADAAAGPLIMKETDKQPVGTDGVGREKDESEGAEVAGRGKPFLYTCYNDGAGNYIDPDWKSWTCWRCGTTHQIL
jgi:hypothetical protein